MPKTFDGWKRALSEHNQRELARGGENVTESQKRPLPLKPLGWGMLFGGLVMLATVQSDLGDVMAAAAGGKILGLAVAAAVPTQELLWIAAGVGTIRGMKWSWTLALSLCVFGAVVVVARAFTLPDRDPGALWLLTGALVAAYAGLFAFFFSRRVRAAYEVDA